MGLLSALAGLILDPYEGSRSFRGYLSALGFVAGVFKGLLGLLVRPSLGVLEAASKLTQGMGLVFKGKKGIQGKEIRRVAAPGTPMQNVVINDQGQVAKANHDQLVAAWQQSLIFIAPTMANDKVVDVMSARSSRVVLLTDRHIAYLFAKHHSSSASTTYKVKWVIPNDLVDNIRSVEDTFRITIDYRRPISVSCLGKTLSLRLPLRKGLRCSNMEGHRSLIFALNAHVQRSDRAGTAGPDRLLGAWGNPEEHIRDLSIVRTPAAGDGPS